MPTDELLEAHDIAHAVALAENKIALILKDGLVVTMHALTGAVASAVQLPSWKTIDARVAKQAKRPAAKKRSVVSRSIEL